MPADEDASAQRDSPTSASHGEKLDEPENVYAGERRPEKDGIKSDNEEDSGYEGEDGDDDDDDDDDNDLDDDEPALKYRKIEGAIPGLLKAESASAMTVSNKRMALGTHEGVLHILDFSGERIKSFKPHQASIIDIDMQQTADFVATASMDGQIVIHSLSSLESYAFDMKRPMLTVSLEPNFSKKSTRAFVCGGMAGDLVLYEKGWFGHSENKLHGGEGPIWQARWKGRLIAWASDSGVKIYDVSSRRRVCHIDRPPDSPRADLFKCTLNWRDASTLLIGWADQIKIVRIKARPKNAAVDQPIPPSPFIVEIAAVFQVDYMVSGIVPYPNLPTSTPSSQPRDPSVIPSASSLSAPSTPTLPSLLILAYIPPPTDFSEELTFDHAQQRRLAAEKPELRIITSAGEENTPDVLSLAGYQKWSCGDYVLCAADESDDQPSFAVMSPKGVLMVRSRDDRDHVEWLVERRRYEEALEAVEKLECRGIVVEGEDSVVGVKEIGRRYIEHLVGEDDYLKAAGLCPKVCAQDPKQWENWIFVFAEKRQLQAIIPYVPTDSPRLSHLVYEMVLAHFLTHDRQTLLKTIKDWPKEIYDISAVIVAVQSELDRSSSTPTSTKSTSAILMECLAELHIANRQPGKALSYYLRLRRPHVFDLIRENNLFTDVQDQALLLVEFDHELMEKRKQERLSAGDAAVGLGTATRSEAITLLVDHIHSIPIGRVVQQLQSRSYYLFLYLDALFAKDPYLVTDFADVQVKLYAEFAPYRLIDFLRASNFYSLEAAYQICSELDFVSEMVFLLGRMGNNKKALTVIIERLGDVHRAIDFAKEQSDDDLWEDLLRYSETRPSFIRGLLENVGADIDPIRIIRRIKNGLEIPGLKDALIKILQDFHLQISLLEGCKAILYGDGGMLANKVRANQTTGFFISGKSICPICSKALIGSPQLYLLLFLCRHAVHVGCIGGEEDLSLPPHPALAGPGAGSSRRNMSAKLAFTLTLKAKVAAQGCPVCYKKAEGQWT